MLRIAQVMTTVSTLRSAMVDGRCSAEQGRLAWTTHSTLRSAARRAWKAAGSARAAWSAKNSSRPAWYAAVSLSRNRRRKRRESTSTERRKRGRQAIQCWPSGAKPPPGTMIWACGWWHPRPQYPERGSCSGPLPLSSASWCYLADPSQTEARRWGGLCHGPSREATEDSRLDAVGGVRRGQDLATTVLG